jgi:hypothetical protein
MNKIFGVEKCGASNCVWASKVVPGKFKVYMIKNPEAGPDSYLLLRESNNKVYEVGTFHSPSPHGVTVSRRSNIVYLVGRVSQVYLAPLNLAEMLQTLGPSSRL